MMYTFQEKIIFHPQPLSKDFKFTFSRKYEEMNFKMPDGAVLNGALFKADSSKGLIFFLHGNSGSINSESMDAGTFTDLQYDFFIIDYRGFGKSDGVISSQEQIFQDIQTVYDALKKKYNEDKIIVVGFSVGTGIASRIASVNNPGLLILEVPYYSALDMMQHRYYILPSFILKYKFETDEYIKDCKMPIVDFHGDDDHTIYYGSSLKLKELFKKSDTLITLKGQGHNGFSENPEYLSAIKKILN